MSHMRSLSDMGKRLTSNPAVRYISLAVILLCLFVFLLKSCATDLESNITYTIGQDSRWRSLNLMGKERNLTAFNNDLLISIAKKEKFNIQMVIEPAVDLLKDLESGKLQGIIANVQPSNIYENRLLFSQPILKFGPVLILRSSAPVAGWNEMGKKIIGVQPHVATELNLEKDPTVQVHLYEDILKALTDLHDRIIDGVIYPAFPAHVYTNTFYPKDLKIVTLPLTEEGLHFITLKNEAGERLMIEFNEGFEAIKQSGQFNQMIEQWGLVNVEDIAS